MSGIRNLDEAERERLILAFIPSLEQMLPPIIAKIIGSHARVHEVPASAMAAGLMPLLGAAIGPGCGFMPSEESSLRVLSGFYTVLVASSGAGE
jgi:hypothetical protein